SNTYAMGLVEQYAQARYREDGQVKVEQTGNIMYARVMHSYDDAGMPHAHEHMGVVNATQNSDGKIVPLDNRQIWANSALVGSATARVLADKVRELGYEIQVHPNGKGWDIANMPREIIEANSVRSAEIKDRLVELGTAGHGANRIARYETRDFEGKLTDPEKLNDRNRTLDQAQGFDGYALVEGAKARAAEASRKPEGVIDHARVTITQFFKTAIERHNLASEHKLNNNPYLPSNIKAFTRDQGTAMSYVALASALDHKEQREAAFKERDVLRHALDYQYAGVTLEKLQTIMQQHKDAGLIIPGIAAKDGTPSAYITTKDSLATEKAIIEKIESGKGTVEPFLRPEQVKDALQPYLPIDKDTGETRQLTGDQLKAAEAILSQSDRHIAIQGFSGTGKTSVLGPVVAYIKDQGVRVVGLAPTTRAVHEMKAVGMEAQTIASFIQQNQAALRGNEAAIDKGRAEYGGAVIITDEMSMVGNRDANETLSLTEAFGVRQSGDVGDSYQLQAVDAGKAFEMTQKMDVVTVSLQEIVRQRTENLKAFNEHIRVGEVDKAFDKITENITEIDDYLGAAVDKYMSLSPAERADTLVMTGGNEDRNKINDAIQTELKLEGTLPAESIQHTIFESRGLTDSEMRDIYRYQEGNVLRVSTNSQSLGLKRGDYEVTNIDKRRVYVTNAKGESFNFNPRDYVGGNVSRPDAQGRREAVSLYEKRDITLHESEQVRWSSPDNRNGIANGDTATVDKIEGGNITFKLNDGRELTYGQNDAQIRNFDLNYAVNSHKGQGASAGGVIAAVDAYHKLLTTLRSTYVNMTRPISWMSVYTASAEKFRETVKTSNTDKMSATEAAGQYPYLNQSHDPKDRAQDDFHASLNAGLEYMSDEAEAMVELADTPRAGDDQAERKISDEDDRAENPFESQAARATQMTITDNEAEIAELPDLGRTLTLAADDNTDLGVDVPFDAGADKLENLPDLDPSKDDKTSADPKPAEPTPGTDQLSMDDKTPDVTIEPSRDFDIDI
ncbi:MAG: AAA family ATPase, partial [Betaproteobacteria bacterium]|nr:AAA family ATPase [Betaproteobacteria bacterium]